MQKDKIQEELELAHQTSQALEAQLKASNDEVSQLSQKIQQLQEQLEEERHSRQQQLDAQRGEFHQAYNALAAELEKRKQEYNRMEANYYAHVRTIRATDDDLSTVQKGIGQLLGQLSNMCMSIRSKADRKAGTSYILEHWPDMETIIKEQMFKEGEDTLDVGFIGAFTERYLVEAVLGRMFATPIHPGVRINESFERVAEWFEKRNPQWATRLRQQASALVVKNPLDDEQAIEAAKQVIVDDIMQNLKRIYPAIDVNIEKKLLAIVERASRLNLAIKGQEIPIVMQSPKEGEATFDESIMKAASKGKSEGIVTMVISPGFVAIDPSDTEHGFMVPAKVLCL
ncbi:hypothetical protein BX666DRAFT_1854681 [Dichotomocladium elegans]|nr:hypothetical protein BX666DRAFT_1854681 [Dichotomocladium elegans]